jgi:hypothetical protein
MTLLRSVTSLRSAALAVVALGVIAGCNGADGPVTNTPGPLAFVRIINAIPDTQAMVYKFTDSLENPLDANGVAFRTASAYQGYKPGVRTFRAFALNANASLAIAAGAPILDQQVTIQDGVYYTFVHYGRANPANADSLAVIIDSIPTLGALGAANIAVRALHFASGVAGVDVFTTRRPTDALPSTPAFAGLQYRASTGNTYTIRSAAVDSLTARVRVVAAPAVVLAALGQPGEASSTARPANESNPLSGTRVGGSIMSVIAFPAPTVTTRAGAADTLPVLRWFVDGRAPNTQAINR